MNFDQLNYFWLRYFPTTHVQRKNCEKWKQQTWRFFWSSDFGIFEEHSDRKAIELVEKNLQECRTLVRNITKIPVVRLLRAICYKHDNWIPGVALKPARRHCECCQSRFIFTQKVAKKGDFANEPQEEDWRLSHAIRSFEKNGTWFWHIYPLILVFNSTCT